MQNKKNIFNSKNHLTSSKPIPINKTTGFTRQTKSVEWKKKMNCEKVTSGCLIDIENSFADFVEILVVRSGGLAAGGFCTAGTQPLAHPMADYRRLSCPSCGRSYKYRGGLLRHIAECFSENEKMEAAALVQQQQQQQFTTKDVKVLYKFWRS